MTQFLLVVAVALTVGAVVFGITMLVTGEDQGLRPVQPDGRAVPLPPDRPLAEPDLAEVRFDTALRGYRMAQVDAALRRAAYDIGYKDELVKVLQAEVDALREGRLPDAEVLRRAREAALVPVLPATAPLEQVPPEPPGLPEPAPPAEPPVDAGSPADVAAAAADPEPAADAGSAADPELAADPEPVVDPEPVADAGSAADVAAAAADPEPAADDEPSSDAGDEPVASSSDSLSGSR